MEWFDQLTNRGLKHCLMMVLLLLFYVPLAFSQSANALYLKDGSRIIGHVLSLDSLGDVSIRTTEGEMVSVPMADVDDINWSYMIKAPRPGAIYRLGDKFYWKHKKVELSDRDYERFFDDDLYHTYVGGSNQLNLGGACWLYSFTCAVISVLMIDFNADKQDSAVFLYAAGANVLACLGGVFTGIGKGRLNWVERTFNEQNAASNELSYSSKNRNSVKLSPSVLMSAQKNLALGATFSISF